MSGSILTELIGGLTGDSMSGLSQQLGVDENMTSQALSLAIPVMAEKGHPFWKMCFDRLSRGPGMLRDLEARIYDGGRWKR